jgi:hypothetical protein
LVNKRKQRGYHIQHPSWADFLAWLCESYLV